MTKRLHHLFKNHDGTTIVETAVVFPMFLVLALGIADVGGGMFIRMSVNAATQAGASYAATHPGTTLSDVETAMDQAVGNSLFCTTATNPGAAICTASLPSQCAAPPPCVISVTASYLWTPMLPTATYSWAVPLTIAYTTTIRVI